MDNKSKIYVSREGYNQYIEALAECKQRYAEHTKTRADYGKNEVENYQTGVYDTEASILLGSIRDLNETISRLHIIENEQQKDGVIGLEDIVTIIFNDTNEIKQVKLTGGMPVVDRTQDIVTVTVNSPIGKAVYKKSVGETVSYSVGKNTFAITIISKEAAYSPNKEKQPLDD